MDIWTTIKVLRNRGVSIRQISKQLRISRNTVRRYINIQHPPHYEKSVEYLPKSKWEKYRKEIMQMYYNKRFLGSRIFEELKGKGAKGSPTGFYSYLKKIRGEDIWRIYQTGFVKDMRLGLGCRPSSSGLPTL